MLIIWLPLLLSAITDARHFDNPVVPDSDTPDPGVVKLNGVYYAATTGTQDPNLKFPIRTSTDLQNWEFVTSVFNSSNTPVWSTNAEYWAPEIHIIGDNQFRVYYTTREAVSKRLAIGAAYATNILGPYYAMDKPLVLDLSQDILDATLINQNGTLYLVWKGSEWMYGRPMQSDGLSFTDANVTLVMRNDLQWESYIIEGPWFINRNGMFYMFYSGNEYCGTKYAVGVARSSNPLGPYEKRGDPILVTDNELAGPGHCSVVKDIDDENDVIVFHAYKATEVCERFPRLMCVRSLDWGEDGWPFVVA